MAEAVARVGPGLGMQPGGGDAKKWRKVYFISSDKLNNVYLLPVFLYFSFQLLGRKQKSIRNF